MRFCSKPGCTGHAVGTLTYDYQNSTVVLGPLATSAEPHSYDMCERHLTQLTVPKGWDVIRLDINYEQAAPSEDDLMALVEAVREAATGGARQVSGGFTSLEPSGLEEFAGAAKRHAHLEVVDGAVAEVKRAEPSSPEPPQQGPF